MRKLFFSLVSASTIVLSLGSLQAQASTQEIHLQNNKGSINATLTIDTNSISLVGTVTVTATGKTYGIDAAATLSGTPGHYTVSGTVDIYDGTTLLKEFTFTCPGTTTWSATTSFVTQSINAAVAVQPPAPKLPPSEPAPIAPSAD